MKDKSNSDFGNNCSRFGKRRRRGREGKMTTQALTSAVGWLEDLYKVFHRGPGDKEYLVRHRISEESGVDERYLYRLKYQRKGMKDVAGEAYRLLDLTHKKYVGWCEANEEAADAYRAERLELRKQHEANRGPASQGD
jgi:hypothetical protein